MEGEVYDTLPTHQVMKEVSLTLFTPESSIQLIPSEHASAIHQEHGLYK